MAVKASASITLSAVRDLESCTRYYLLQASTMAKPSRPTGEVLIDSESVNIVMNGSKYSRFAANYVQFGNYQLRRTSDGGLAFKITDI